MRHHGVTDERLGKFPREREKFEIRAAWDVGIRRRRPLLIKRANDLDSPLSLWPSSSTFSRFLRFALISSRSTFRASSISLLILRSSSSLRSRIRRCSAVSSTGGAVIWAKGSTISASKVRAMSVCDREDIGVRLSVLSQLIRRICVGGQRGGRGWETSRGWPSLYSDGGNRLPEL